MAKSKEYWAKRSEQRLARVLADAEKTLKLLESQYKNASIGINKDIKKLYSQFAGENNISMDRAMELIHGSEYLEWRMSMEEYLRLIDINNDQKLLLELNTLAMRSRITRLEALNAEILANVAILAQEADNRTGELLERSLENAYYEGMYDEYKDRNPKVYELMSKHNVGISKAQIDRELKVPWSGANYSTNLWRNADYIANKCQQLVAQNIIAGTSIDRLTREITKQFGKNYRASARRLLLTESAYIKGQADKLTYERLGIEEYEILATLDRRTSKICQSKDGEHYPIDEAKVGENYPPFHPHCRTTTVKYNPDTEGRTRIARDADGKNVTVPYDMKYKEWKDWVEASERGYNNKKVSGGISGAITETDSPEARKYAETEYGSIRKRKVDVERISKNTGYSKKQIQEIKNYLFIDKHNLGSRFTRFDPSFEIAQSWNRLMNGNIESHDLTLIKHEIYEKELISNGMSQDDAHKETSKIYNYQKEAEEYYDSLKKRKKRK